MTDTRPTKAGPIGPGEPEQQKAVTGRPNDTPEDNSTFANRAKARAASEKRIASAENKAVQSADTKKKG